MDAASANENLYLGKSEGKIFSDNVHCPFQLELLRRLGILGILGTSEAHKSYTQGPDAHCSHVILAVLPRLSEPDSNPDDDTAAIYVRHWRTV